MATQNLSNAIKLALGVTKQKVNPKRHTYIAGPAACGKTSLVTEVINEHGINVTKISGSASMAAFVQRLAYAVYAQPEGEINFWVDDCDCLFIGLDNMNVMKGALDDRRATLRWEKNLTAQATALFNSTNAHGVRMAAALRHFMTADGIEIPTDRVRFIITGNKALASWDDAQKHPTNMKKLAEAGLRDRVIYHDCY